MNELEKLFAMKETENGDISYNTIGNKLLDVLFMTSYFEKHLDEVKIGKSEKEKLFSMFIRDPRHGLGRRDLGRKLMEQAEVEPRNILFAGRADDLISIGNDGCLDFLKSELYRKNYYVKKWMPRLTSSDKQRQIAKTLCYLWGMSEKKYRRLIKCDTTEYKLSHNENIVYEHVPSLAMIKYFKRFLKDERFHQYINEVKNGEKKLNISTTNAYDIYRNRSNIDADMFFEKLEKIKINCVPIIDTSASMNDDIDSYGKAVSIGHYLGKCTDFCNGYTVCFSSRPWLMKITGEDYNEEIQNLYTGDVSHTNFAAVMELFKNMDETPEWLVVLSDMEFDIGSHQNKVSLQNLWKSRGYTTKIVWWNFNARNKTVPEFDDMGNVFISGYSPQILKFLEVGFDGERFLNKLLDEYKNKLTVN